MGHVAKSQKNFHFLVLLSKASFQTKHLILHRLFWLFHNDPSLKNSFYPPHAPPEMRSELVFLRENIEVLQNSPLCEVVIGRIKGDQVQALDRPSPLGFKGASDLPGTSFPHVWRAIEICFGSNTSASVSLRDSNILETRSPSSKHPGLQAR